MFKIEYFGNSEVGRRPRNEDSFSLFVNKHGFTIAVIADGMGGHKGGATCSKAVTRMCKRELNNVNFGVMSDEEIKKKLLVTVRIFQKDLIRVGEEHPELADMGSTLNMNIFVGKKMYTVNIGDSRTQSFIKKEIVQITEDHNLATLAEKDERYAHYKGQTNMLISSLGPNKNTKADLFVTELDPKKGYILMTTDGVHNSISEISWMKILKSSKSLEEKVDRVINTAYENGSNDNMTFILVEYKRD